MDIRTSVRADGSRPTYRSFQMVALLTIAILSHPVLAAVGDITTVAGLINPGPEYQADVYGPGSVALDSSGNLYIGDGTHFRVRKIDTLNNITTYAGTGVYGSTGDGGAATAASLVYPSRLVIDAADNLYIAETLGARIRKVDAATGIISTVVGTGVSGYSGDNGAATSAQISRPGGLALDSSGNLYFADSGNHCIRRVDAATGNITTVAGTGVLGFSGDGGAATSAQLYNPYDVDFDSAGNFYIVSANHRVRKVDIATGNISSIAGTGMSNFAGDGGAATSASLSYPNGIAIDSSDNIYIADTWNQRVRRIDATTGNITTIAGNGTNGYDGDGGSPTAARVGFPADVTVTASGDYYVVSADQNFVRLVSGGVITSVARRLAGLSGDGGAAISAQLHTPSSSTFDSNGDLYIADTWNHHIRKVDNLSGNITTVAGFGGSQGYSGDGSLATSARLNYPEGAVLDSIGNLYIADTNSNRIRKVDALSGIISTFAGDGTYAYSGDGGAATAAALCNPKSVALDSAENLYIADTSNRRIRRIDSLTGIITTVAGDGTLGSGGDGGAATAAQLNYPTGIAIDGSDNLYIADKLVSCIRKVDASNGIISTVAGVCNSLGFSGDGGLATVAKLNNPSGIAVDRVGNLYVADQNNQRIRQVRVTTGIITTVAGSGVAGYSGDNGPATSAQLDQPNGLALDVAGNLYITDTNNHRIRKVLMPDIEPPLITLNGNTPMIVAQGGSYVEPDAVVTDNVDSGLGVTISGMVDTYTLGSYNITYDAVDTAGNTSQVIRVVTVTDQTAPMITLVGPATQTVAQGSSYTDLGATVSDNIDTGLVAVVSGSVDTNTVGSYTLTFNATDNGGNAATPVQRTVNVTDQTAPVITLLGSNPMSVNKGSTFADPGTTVSDNVDTGLTATVTGSVDTTTIGSYTLTYNVSDTAGNAAIAVTRTVNVVAPTSSGGGGSLGLMSLLILIWNVTMVRRRATE